MPLPAVAMGSLYPYPSDLVEPSKLILGHIRRTKVLPLACLAHAVWQAQGCVQNYLLPDGDHAPTMSQDSNASPRKLSDDATDFSAAVDDDSVPLTPPGFKGCVNPSTMTMENVEHILSQAAGEKGVQGILSDEILKKLQSALLKILLELMTK